MNRTLILFSTSLLAGCFSVKNTYPTYRAEVQGVNGNDVAVGFSGNVFQMKNVTSVGGVAYSFGNAYGTKNQFYSGTGLYSGQAESWQEMPFRAKIIMDRIEDSGFIIRSPKPKYILDVENVYQDCEPPSICSVGDFLKVYLPTLTFAGRSEQCYQYKMKIYDAATGKVLHSRMYNFQGYIVSVQLIPVFYALKHPGNEYYQQWVLQIADDAIKQFQLLEKK